MEIRKRNGEGVPFRWRENRREVEVEVGKSQSACGEAQRMTSHVLAESSGNTVRYSREYIGLDWFRVTVATQELGGIRS